MAKNKAPKGKKAFEQGYVSFDPDDIKQQANDNMNPNHEAYGYLDDAMFTSSHVTANDKKRGVVDIDDVYPITLAETKEMEGYLDKAQAAVKDESDAFFYERYGELRGIVNWSLKRHWNFSFSVIFGVIITAFFLSYQADDAKKDAIAAEREVDRVKAWIECDTTITLEQFNREGDINRSTAEYENRLNNAKLYKAYIAGRAAANYYGWLRAADKQMARIDTASTEQAKKDYKKYAEENLEKAKEDKKEFEEIAKLDFDSVKDRALKSVKNRASDKGSSAAWIKFWNIFFFLLIPVYIFADRPFGYTMSRNRVEAKVLGGIKKWGFALAGGLLGIAGSIGFVEVVTKWSDGRTTREDDGTGPIRLAAKIGFLIAAVVVFCAVSCFLMLWSTVTGLMRNYDWKAIMAEIQAKKDKLQPKQTNQTNQTTNP